MHKLHPFSRESAAKSACRACDLELPHHVGKRNRTRQEHYYVPPRHEAKSHKTFGSKFQEKTVFEHVPFWLAVSEVMVTK